MHIPRFILLFLPLTICCVSNAQPVFSIVKIVSQNNISNDEASRIQQYATGWANALLTKDTFSLFNAQRHLIEPLEPEVGMSAIGRSLYGKALKEAFKPLLSPENDNEMAAINSLQVLSLVGNEQSCGILINHADTLTEQRASLRLWASAGLGKTFKTGVLQTQRIIPVAELLADFASREPNWYVVARMFDSLTSLQHVPGLNSRQQSELEELSLQLQTRALVELMNDIRTSTDSDERVRSLPFVLSSLRLQLIEPSIDAKARSTAEQGMLATLIRHVDYVTNYLNPDLIEDDSVEIIAAYGESANVAGFIIDHILECGDSGVPSILNLWNAGDRDSIDSRVKNWKRLCNL